MSSITLPKWDKNRPIFFQLGMILSLFCANLIINYETPIPIPEKYETVDLSDNNFQNVQSHTEQVYVNPKPIVKLNPLISKLILVDNLKEEISEVTTPEIQEPATSTTDEPIISMPEIVEKLVIEKPKVDNKVWSVAEFMPYLKDCDMNITEDERRICTQQSILHFVNKHLKYPAAAREIGLEGTVVVSFVIDKEGKMKDMSIARDIGGGCGQAALKALSGLSEWKPGKQNHQPVNVKYSIPIRFKLN
jgi:protein TonB